MKVCIVGGGNIGTALACYIKKTCPDYFVSLLTRKPNEFSENIKCNDWEADKLYIVTLDCISGDANVAAQDADIVYIALPHFAVEKAFSAIAPFVAKEAFVGVLPGGGGCEFFFDKYFTKEQTLFGFQRVPFIARLGSYGKEVNLNSWKPFSVVGALKQERIAKVCRLVEACGLRTEMASNYLEVALTPSNPILHTSRLFEIFGRLPRNHVFPERFKFYVGWSDFASSMLFNMDEELHLLLNVMTGIDTTSIRPLSEHYESPTIQLMTKKINSIAAFQHIYAPLVEVEGGYCADTTSRMFTEDFPWGLVVIRSYFEYFGIPSPQIDEVLQWYSRYMGLEWFVDGKFCGKDLLKTGAIQNYGIKTKEDLLNKYQ